MLLIIVFFIGFYIWGPSRRKSGGSQLPYDQAIARNEKGLLGISISNQRLIREIALNPGYPERKYKKFRSRVQILRILYVISILMVKIGLDDTNKAVFLSGLAVLTGSLILRSVFYGKTSGKIAEEAAANQQLYEAVATFNGWWYDSDWHSKYRPINTARPPQT